VLNAIRYTNEGRVVVSTRKSPGMVTVSVLDTGPGIPKIVHRKIFDDFYQHNNPARTKDQGSGLGLAIVKRISVLLKLEVSLESSEDSGTVFTVNIPLAEEASEIIEPAHRHSMSDASMKSLDGAGILAVDDNPDILDALGQLLSDWGCIVSKAQSSEAALQIMSEGNIDFALIDDMLGEHETGLDLAIDLANNIPKSRILLITGNVLPNRLSTIREHGFSVFLKPLDPRILFEELSSGRR
jgi:CheY-like chemotaxis protein